MYIKTDCHSELNCLKFSKSKKIKIFLIQTKLLLSGLNMLADF